MEFEHHVARAGGCEIHYQAAGNGPAVLYLHGGGGFRFDAQSFTTLAQQYRLLVPSMPGFDDSTPGTTQSVEDVADVVADFIREVVGGPSRVIGESFGGGVATWLAVRHPNAVELLVLAAPSGIRDGSGVSPSPPSPAERYTLLYGGRPREANRPDDQARLQRNRANSDRLHSSRPGFDQALQDGLPELQAPTLLLWGTADRLVPADHARYYTAIPRHRVIVLEGGPHVLSAGAPDQFLPPVLAFFEQGAAFLTEATPTV